MNKFIAAVLAFPIAIAIIAPVFALTGQFYFQPDLSSVPFGNWYAFSIGQAIGAPVVLIVAAAISVLAYRASASRTRGIVKKK